MKELLKQVQGLGTWDEGAAQEADNGNRPVSPPQDLAVQEVSLNSAENSFEFVGSADGLAASPSGATLVLPPQAPMAAPEAVSAPALAPAPAPVPAQAPAAAPMPAPAPVPAPVQALAPGPAPIPVPVSIDVLDTLVADASRFLQAIDADVDAHESSSAFASALPSSPLALLVLWASCYNYITSRITMVACHYIRSCNPLLCLTWDLAPDICFTV